MIAGYSTVDGQRVRLGDINPILDAARFNASPATLAHLINTNQSRTAEGLNFSASQLSVTPRQHLMRAISDSYPTTGKAMASLLGTMKHEKVNVKNAGMIVEERFVSKRDPRLSGRIDHAALIKWDEPLQAWIADLYDLKTTKWYSTTLIAKDVWKNHPDYAWQLNLCALMMEENGIGCPSCVGTGVVYGACNGRNDPALMDCAACTGTGVVAIRIRDLYLECIPADSSYTHESEAAKLGFAEWQKVIVQVERRAADHVYAVYQAAIALRDKTIADGYAPICKDRWSNRKVQDLRCKHFCDVAEECAVFSTKRLESHPLVDPDVTLANQLAASLEPGNAQFMETV